ncbi:MAG: hypothetical protein R2788_12030 [Saprospiraceae bacterium]
MRSTKGRKVNDKENNVTRLDMKTNSSFAVYDDDGKVRIRAKDSRMPRKDVRVVGCFEKH